LIGEFKDFKYDVLKDATNGFAKENEMAKSGSAIIYKVRKPHCCFVFECHPPVVYFVLNNLMF
jgi:hypothetical protein